MEEIKPLKRSKELAPLSREHHDGLLFAWKIKQGLANGTPIKPFVVIRVGFGQIILNHILRMKKRYW